MIISVDSRYYPLVRKGSAFFNTIAVSPWSGTPWARVDRKAAEWFPVRLPAAGEPPWPLPESIPGSLFTDYDEWKWGILVELPRTLLLRELHLLERWTSRAMSVYNGPTPPVQETLVNPSLMQEIAALRAKEAAGTLTDDELRAALRKMREGRVTAAAVSAKARTPKAVIDPDAALAALLS